MADPLRGYSACVAPEMEEGDRRFDGAADVWGWAVLLWSLLAWRVMDGGRNERHRLASLPQAERAAWEHLLHGPDPAEDEAVGEEQWSAVLGL